MASGRASAAAELLLDVLQQGQVFLDLPAHQLGHVQVLTVLAALQVRLLDLQQLLVALDLTLHVFPVEACTRLGLLQLLDHLLAFGVEVGLNDLG